ncbi:MAG: pilus assembly protein TadG-related protein [Acidimicrobiales bacterium]
MTAAARHDCENGSISMFVAVFFRGPPVMAGLVIDGGTVLAARRRSAHVAEQAARSGAQALDEGRLRAGGGYHLDPVAARRKAEQYLADTGHRGTVTITGETVTVTVTIEQPLSILGIAGLADATVIGRGSAHGIQGVTQEANP